jgi:hypothetical protein
MDILLRSMIDGSTDGRVFAAVPLLGDASLSLGAIVSAPLPDPGLR